MLFFFFFIQFAARSSHDSRKVKQAKIAKMNETKKHRCDWEKMQTRVWPPSSDPHIHLSLRLYWLGTRTHTCDRVTDVMVSKRSILLTIDELFSQRKLIGNVKRSLCIFIFSLIFLIFRELNLVSLTSSTNRWIIWRSTQEMPLWKIMREFCLYFPLDISISKNMIKKWKNERKWHRKENAFELMLPIDCTLQLHSIGRNAFRWKQFDEIRLEATNCRRVEECSFDDIKSR